MTSICDSASEPSRAVNPAYIPVESLKAKGGSSRLNMGTYSMLDASAPLTREPLVNESGRKDGPIEADCVAQAVAAELAPRRRCDPST